MSIPAEQQGFTDPDESFFRLRALELVNSDGNYRQEVESTPQTDFLLSEDEARYISESILETADFWLTVYYSLAMHNEGLREHLKALETRIKANGNGIAVPVRLWDYFHHPDEIRANASQIVGGHVHHRQGANYVGAENAWSGVVKKLAIYNLQLLQRIEEIQVEIGMAGQIDRSARVATWTDEQDTAILEAGYWEELVQLAGSWNVPVDWVTRRRYQLVSAEQDDSEDELLSYTE